MLNRKMKVLLGTAVVALGAAAAGAADSSPIRHMYFATSPDDGGLGGGLASIHRIGAFPGPVWTVDQTIDAVFQATFSGGPNVDTSGAWDGSSNICCMGADTETSFGEIFSAPSSELTSFGFLVQKSQFGHLGWFGIAPVDFGDPFTAFVGPPIFVEEFVGVSGPDYQWQFFGGLHVTLDPSHEYVAYLSTIPEPSTWAMMGIGFATLGFAAYRQRRVAPAPAEASAK
jgi:PEP-CTERM motif